VLIEIITFMLLGILFGTFTGLIPGIHINLVGVSLVALSVSLLSSINPIYLVVFIAAMAITHTFVDFIPSIFLGCPDTDTELSILPGHELLKKGQGYSAIILTCYGSLAAIFILMLIAVPSLLLVQKVYGFLQNIMPYLLIAVSGMLIILEKNKFPALFVFFLAGILGLCVLNLDVKEPLLPLLTGLFGSSMLVMSIKNKTIVPKQKISKPKIKNRLFSPLLGALIASPLSSLLPGLGSGQAAIIGNTISRTDRQGFLVLLGATNTIVMGFSFIALYIVSRTRTGAAVAINNLLGNFSWQILILILTVVFFAGIISFFLTSVLARFFSRKISKINYTKLSFITLGILVIIVLIVSKFFGLIILVFSTLTGIYCISLGVRRTNMMGCLLIPTIVFYLF
jgi:putative membrane protein